MVRPNREKLKGVVETDETFVRGEDPKGGAWIEQKALVVIAAEEDGTGIGRIRMATIAAKTRVHLHRFAKPTIEPGSVIHTDGRPAYDGLDSLAAFIARWFCLCQMEAEVVCRVCHFSARRSRSTSSAVL
jgi:transposase-like protein